MDVSWQLYVREMCSFLFFKQKTEYELRISDWSSDVCASDRRPRIAGGDMDIVTLECAAWKVRGIGCPGPQLLQRVRLPSECLEKRERKLCLVKWLGSQQIGRAHV